MRAVSLCLVVCGVVGGILGVSANEETHRYEKGETVTLWVTKVGPYHNPQEVYSFFTIPWCRTETPLSPATKPAGFGEILEGVQWENSDLLVQFGIDTPETNYCHMELDEKTASFFDYAIANHYWYQMVLDDLPEWGVVGDLITGEEALAHVRAYGETMKDEVKMLGEVDAVKAATMEEARELEDVAFLYRHKKIEIGYNGDRIVSFNLTSEAPEHVGSGRGFDLSYSVRWVKSDAAFEDRYRKFLDHEFFHHKVHYYALVNSFVLVLFVVMLVAFVLIRTLRADVSRYLRAADDDGIDVEAASSSSSSSSTPQKGGRGRRAVARDHGSDDEAEEEGGEEENGSSVTDEAAAAAAALEAALVDESGWKQVRGDVFRRPMSPEMFAALLGSGAQLTGMGIGTVLAALAGSLYVDRGSVSAAMLILYALTSFLAGIVSGAWYRRQFHPRPAPSWKHVMFLTASLFPILGATVILNLNLLAGYYNTVNAIPFSTVVFILLAWATVNLPLVVAGTLLGRSWCGTRKRLPRINPVPRPVPTHRFLTHPVTLALLAGVAPFCSIFIETYFIFASFWGYRVYYVFELLLLVVIVLVIVVSCVSIVVTYVLLSVEDHRWHWPAFATGASVGLWVFLYAVYYFLFRTYMHGILQTSFFFGYTSLGCLALAIACGTIAFASSSLFVHAIFNQIKGD